MYEVSFRSERSFFPSSNPVEIPLLPNELYQLILEKLIAPFIPRNRKKEEIILQLFQTSMVCKEWYLLSHQMLYKICPFSIKNFSESVFKIFSVASAARVCILKHNWQKQIFLVKKIKIKSNSSIVPISRRPIMESTIVLDRVDAQNKQILLAHNVFHSKLGNTLMVAKRIMYGHHSTFLSLWAKQVGEVEPVLYLSKDQRFIATQQMKTDQFQKTVCIFIIYVILTGEKYGSVRISARKNGCVIKKSVAFTLSQIQYDATTFSYCMKRHMYTNYYDPFIIEQNM
jgi:hypothetical protein